jgi:glycine oxidase
MLATLQLNCRQKLRVQSSAHSSKKESSLVKALVIGGGIIGSAVAWRLAGEKVSVKVFERGRLGREASWAAAGMIAPQAEAEGPGPFVDFCLQARFAFESIHDRLIRESGVDPEYDEVGVLYVALDGTEREELAGRARWQREAGLSVDELTGEQARKIAPMLSPEVNYALSFPSDRRLDNRKLTQAYVNAATKAGVEFIEGAQVDEIHGGKSPSVRFADGSVHQADVIVNAAGPWSGQIRGLEADRIAMRPVRGQILCFDARPGILGPSIFSLRGYLVPRRDGRLLTGSTREDAGFDKNVTLDGMQRILSGAKSLVPALASIAFREAWAGLRPATPDLLPVLGHSPNVPGVIYATGHFRSGILLSALTAELVANLVAGRKISVDLAPFSPARFSPQSALQK